MRQILMFTNLRTYSVGYWPMEDQGGIFLSNIASGEDMNALDLLNPLKFHC